LYIVIFKFFDSNSCILINGVWFQGQCLINVGGDVVYVSYYAEDWTEPSVCMNYLIILGPARIVSKKVLLYHAGWPEMTNFYSFLYHYLKRIVLCDMSSVFEEV
jgi:hypothetical protein